jgi:serine protease inhibitor
MVSPASVFLALAMTLNGADSTTREAMLKLLADRGLDVQKVAEGSRSWAAALSRTGPKTVLSIANSIWFRQGFEPDPAFLQTNADFFKAGAKELDFNDKASVDIINGWVKDATRETIKEIVKEIPSSTVMYLINAVYFKSDWQTPFEKGMTSKQNFNAPGGAVENYFMHRTDKITYFTGHGAKGVALPYDDGQFVFFALMPEGEESPRDWLAKQDPSALFSDISGLMAQKANFTVSLAFPRFETSYEDQLNNELISLGMGVAFGGGADFSLLSANRSHDLFISEVKHKTFIRVDEKGTEASAVTSVAIDESAPQYDVEIAFDRPFLYGILDKSTGIPLFVGILEDPSDKG